MKVRGVYAEGVVHEIRPNLTVTSVTDEAVFGDPFSRDVHVQVTNIGNYPSAQTRLGLLRRGQSYTEQNVEEITDTIVVPPLDWSGTWNGMIRITWGGETDLLLDENYSEWITAVVDPDNWIYESDESRCCDPFATGGNNSYSRQISWSIPRVPIVLVPGFTGSTLEQGGVEVWSEDLLMDLLSVSTSNARVRLNSNETEYNGVLKLAGEPIRDLRFPKLLRYLAAIRQPGMMPYAGFMIDHNLDPPAVDLFGGLIDYLVSQGYELGRDLVLCDYDWRKHAQDIAADPLRQPAADIQQAIVDIKQTFGQDTRVAIVSHRLGSLATLAYFQRMERLSTDHSVRNWISIGAPFAGLPYAIGALGGRLSLVSWIPGGGWALASKLAETTRNMTAVHSLLPESGRYTDPVIYEYAVNFPSPLALPAGGQTFASMMQDYPDWWTIRLTDPVYQRGFAYWAAAYHAYDGIDGMTNIVCNNIPTFGGFIKVDVNLVPSNPFGNVHLDTFWVPWGQGVSGDGVVPLSSASQSAQPMPTLYINGTHHSKLPVHEGAIETTYELAQGNMPSFLPDGVSTNSQQFGMGHILLFELRKLYGYITGGIDAPDYDIEGMPVALELYDLDSEELISGCVLPVDQSETPIGPATVLGLDTGMDGFATENQAFLGLTLPQSHSTRNYRLVLVPDPSFWQPGIVTAGESVDDDATFEIGTQLIIRTGFGDWGFPGPESPSEDWIHFTSLRRFPTDPAIGFSAYVDFSITNGRIDQQELTLYYDADGDGNRDGEVTKVDAGESEVTTSRGLAVLPNPSSGWFRASWGRPVGPDGTLRVIDAAGRIIESKSLDPGDVDTSLELSGTVPAGVYFVEIRGSSVHERVRITIVR